VPLSEEHNMQCRTLAAVVAGYLSLSGVAFSADLPDIVRLKNGGMMRGTIVDLVPGDHVSIQLPNGEQRQYPMSDVEYAGSAAREAPPPPAPPAESAAPGPRKQNVGEHGRSDRHVIARVNSKFSPVKLEADDNDITFHVRTGTAQGYVSGWSSTSGGSGAWGAATQVEAYEQLCTAPCTAEIENGDQRFALSKADGKPVAGDGRVSIHGPATIHGKYESYTGTRAVGWLLVLGGAVVVAASPFVAKNDCPTPDYSSAAYRSADPCEPFNTGIFIGMLAAGGAVSLVGILLALKSDESHFTVSPGVASATPKWALASANDRVRGALPVGITGTVHF
jgi:hypothetical protein